MTSTYQGGGGGVIRQFVHVTSKSNCDINKSICDIGKSVRFFNIKITVYMAEIMPIRRKTT